MAINRKMKLSEHFTLGELIQDDVTVVPPTILANLITLCERLEKVRTKLGNKPMVITSGWRTPEHNKAIGGAARSLHLKGMAADFDVPGMTADEVREKVKDWAGGMELGISWIHLDSGPYKRFYP